MPTCAYAHITRPEQSNPVDGLAPPQWYGTPSCESAALAAAAPVADGGGAFTHALDRGVVHRLERTLAEVLARRGRVDEGRHARAGDQRAKAALFDRYAAYVRGIVVRLLGLQRDVPDVVHDVFVAALQDIERLQNEAALKSWLTSIAVFTVAVAVFMSLVVARLITPLLAAHTLTPHAGLRSADGPIMEAQRTWTEAEADAARAIRDVEASYPDAEALRREIDGRLDLLGVGDVRRLEHRRPVHDLGRRGRRAARRPQIGSAPP